MSTSQELQDCPPPQRVALAVEYSGGAFAGFEAKRGAAVRTVQGVMTAAARACGLVEADDEVAGSSRTDAGVHSARNVCQLDLSPACRLPPHKVARKLNDALGTGCGVRVLRSAAAPYGAWHSRASAARRRYRYLLRCAPASSEGDVFWQEHAWRCASDSANLDVAAMRAAAESLSAPESVTLGAFVKRERHRHLKEAREAGVDVEPAYETEVAEVAVYRAAPDLVVFEIEATRFFYSTVRLLVWELVRVGKGQRSAADFAAMVAAGSAARGEVGAAAPPQGLCLLRVLYGAGDDPFDGAELGTAFPLWQQSMLPALPD